MREGVRQFNVYLPTEVIRAVKYHAVDTEQSLSAIVEQAVREYLERHTDPREDDMSTQGIEGLYVETHNWGKTVSFWTGLGYKLQFETDHHSGQLVHPSGGPYVFVAERPATDELETYPVVGALDADGVTVPGAATVDKPFTPEHWGVVEMLLVDPDGRHVSVQAPLPEGVVAPARHG